MIGSGLRGIDTATQGEATLEIAQRWGQVSQLLSIGLMLGVSLAPLSACGWQAGDHCARACSHRMKELLHPWSIQRRDTWSIQRGL